MPEVGLTSPVLAIVNSSIGCTALVMVDNQGRPINNQTLLAVLLWSADKLWGHSVRKNRVSPQLSMFFYLPCSNNPSNTLNERIKKGHEKGAG